MSGGYPAPLPSLESLLGVPSRTLTAAAGAFSLTGVAAALAKEPAEGGDAAPLPSLGLLFARQNTLTASAGAFSVSGQAAGFLRGYVVESAAGSFTLTGKAATLFSGLLPLTAGAGAFAVTGVAVSFVRATRVLPCAAGSFTLTGIAAATKSGRKVVCNAGSYTFTGIAAGLSKSATGSYLHPAPLPSLGSLLSGTTQASTEYPAPLPSLSSLLGGVSGEYSLPAYAGTFVVSGGSADLLRGKGLSCETGEFLVEGAPAERDLQINAETGAFALTGVVASLVRGRPDLTANAGSFVFAGADAGFRYENPNAKVLPGIGGAFLVAGEAASFSVARVLSCVSGRFVVSGMDAALSWPKDPALATAFSGGYVYGKQRTPKDIQAEREKLGILAPKVQKAIKRAAAKVVDRIDTQGEADALEKQILQRQDVAQVTAAAKAEIERANLKWKAGYAAITRALILAAMRDEMELGEVSEVSEIAEIWSMY